MKIADIPENARNGIYMSYAFLALLALLFYPFGAEDRYGTIIFYCLPLFAVSCLLKFSLMMDVVRSRVILVLFSAFSIIVLPIEVGLRSLLSPEGDNSNNKFGHLLTDIGLVNEEGPRVNSTGGFWTSAANFVLTIMVLMDVAFLILQLYLLVTHDCIEEIIEERPAEVQIVRQHVSQVGSSTHAVEDLTPLLEEGEFSQEFVERMKCPICADRVKQKRCHGCKQGMCAVCVAQIEESQFEPACPMCRKPLRTEDIVLCRL